ncbi:DNA-binding response regulator [Planotetraspora silvatica]|uniref:DNA-binding response regulator n=1 Tax=Planotetraspora silvatica TaxID=234614 RepID=A0A8J3UNY7_9ACTN|nr:response regulator transcription factor [Planotetraspora silvatica]GII47262.1 DNA-binding response regulator [Planotetraspora silvatica]
MIRVLIVDDHEVVRQGLRFVLGQEDGIEVVGECADGAHALAAIPALRPDVVLLDMVMPGMDGLAVLRELAGGPAVIVLASFLDDERVIEAVRLGALSYLSKTSAVDQVVEAVRAAAVGGSVLEAGTAALLIERVRQGRRRNPMDLLTPREREVLAELARGRSNAEIARSLRLGRETVKTHVSSILAKLGLADRTQAAIFGLQQGLIRLDEALDT